MPHPSVGVFKNGSQFQKKGLDKTIFSKYEKKIKKCTKLCNTEILTIAWIFDMGNNVVKNVALCMT